jgi:hypothetical protein
VLGASLDPVEQPVRPLQPAIRDRRLAPERAVVPGKPPRQPRSSNTLAPLTVEAVRPLTNFERRRSIVEPPRRHPKPLQRLGSLFLVERRLERRPRALPVPA